MHVPRLSLDRAFDIGHHVAQARAWLDASDNGRHAAAISYAAFEVRLAAERVCMQYYVKLVDSKEAKASPSDLRFRRMKERIFATVGHQKRINKQFDFLRALLRLLRVEATAPTPDLNRLTAIWDDCSEACHVFWNLASATNPPRPDYKLHDDLAQYIDELGAYTAATAWWMHIHEPSMELLCERYAAGDLDDEGLRSELGKKGAFATYVARDGRSQVFGTPIAPQDGGDASDVAP